MRVSYLGGDTRAPVQSQGCHAALLILFPSNANALPLPLNTLLEEYRHLISNIPDFPSSYQMDPLSVLAPPGLLICGCPCHAAAISGTRPATRQWETLKMLRLDDVHIYPGRDEDTQ